MSQSKILQRQLFLPFGISNFLIKMPSVSSMLLLNQTWLEFTDSLFPVAFHLHPSRRSQHESANTLGDIMSAGSPQCKL